MSSKLDIRAKLVAIDFDGTLLHSDTSISERTLAAVRAAMASGIRIMIVTGRPPRWLRPIGDLLDHRGTAIAANGALVIDLETRKVLDCRHVDRAAAATAIERLRRSFPDVRFGVERLDGFAHEHGYPRGIRQSERMPQVAYVDTVEELRVALLEFRETYNATWLVERHGFRPPGAVRQDRLSTAALAA